jgi:hypothetical protein
MRTIDRADICAETGGVMPSGGKFAMAASPRRAALAGSQHPVAEHCAMMAPALPRKPPSCAGAHRPRRSGFHFACGVFPGGFRGGAFKKSVRQSITPETIFSRCKPGIYVTL